MPSYAFNLQQKSATHGTCVIGTLSDIKHKAIRTMSIQDLWEVDTQMEKTLMTDKGEREQE